jgi:predicted nucleic acid-binding protein
MGKRLRIYLDTSIISAYFDYKKPLRQLITQKWFEFESVGYDKYISTLVLEEINNNSNSELKTIMLKLIDDYRLNILEINESALNLAEIYRKEIIKKEINDSIHIAISSINAIDAIVSWNFKHIVNLKTINTIHSINLRLNYQIIEIITPENLGGDKYGCI